jgi:hypothetical protein
MAPDVLPGQLIAVEAVRGRDTERAVLQVREALGAKWRDVLAGVSHWDASGTFYELGLAGRKAVALSPRTLLLLYASDLAFRLRWEIRPAMATGRSVIVAPYVETAMAFGEAAGLPRKWIAELFRFAPRADICLHVKDGKSGPDRKPRPGDGFPEFAVAALRPVKAPGNAAARREMREALNRLKRVRRCEDLRKRTLRPLLKTLRNRTRPPLSKVR